MEIYNIVFMQEKDPKHTKNIKGNILENKMVLLKVAYYINVNCLSQNMYINFKPNFINKYHCLGGIQK